MKNVLFILKDDLRKIFRNPASLIVIGALCFLPSLYAWFNIWASWDPYGNTEGIEIAVTSEDEGAEIAGKDINIGDEIILSLAENDSLGWTFLSKEEAMEGVEHGDYYAAIIIPDTFSQDMISVLDKDIKEPHIDYYINEKINAISPKVTGQGASTIVENIKENFTVETSKAVLTVFDEIGVELDENYAHIERIRDAIFHLEESMPEIYAGIQKVESGIKVAGTAVDRVDDSLDKANDLQDRVNKLNSGLIERIDESEDAADSAITSITEHLQSAQKTFRKIPDLTNNISNKGQDLDQFMTTLRGKQDDLDAASGRLQDISDFLGKQEDKLKRSTKIEDMQQKIDDNKRDLQSLNSDINKIIKDLEDGKHPAVKTVDRLSDSVDRVASSIDGLYDDYEQVISPQLDLAIDELSESANEMSELFDRLEERHDNTLEKVEELRQKAGYLNTEEIKEELETTLDFIDINLDRVDKMINITKVAGLLTKSEKIEGLEQRLTNLQGKLEKAQTMTNATLTGLEKGEELGKKTFDNLEETLSDVGEHIASAQNSFDNKTEKALQSAEKILQDIDSRMEKQFDSMIDMRKNLDDSLDILSNRANNPRTAIGVLNQASRKTTDVIDSFDSVYNSLDKVQTAIDTSSLAEDARGIQTVQDNLHDVKLSIDRIISSIKDSKSSGAEALERIDSQADHIDDALEDMISFVDQDLRQRYTQAMNDAGSALEGVTYVLDDLDAKIPEVRHVLEKLDDGLIEGAEKVEWLDEKFPDANEAINKAANKVRSLQEEGNLDELIDFLRNDPQRISDFIADPIELAENKLFPVPNYGSAMNPFYTTLSLWVGGLLLVSTLKVDRNDKLEFKFYEVYLGRLITFGGIGIIQGLIDTLGNIFLLEAYVAHKFYYVLFGMLIGLVFVSIVYTLTSVFGNVGKVLAIILLVVQLGGSGGTFPIQMAPEFFQKIHAFLPFTHGISLMREAVGGIIWSVVWKKILYLFLYLIGFILLGVAGKKFFNRSSDKFKKKAEQSEFVL